MEKAIIDLQSDDWHGYCAETLWISKTSENLCKLENSPFFAKNLSLGDTVKFEVKNNTNYIVESIARSGNSTYRIIPTDKIGKVKFQNFWKPLEKLGCSYEEGDLGVKIYAINVPKSTNIHMVYELLENGEQNKIWDFEEGHCSHFI